MNNDLKVMSEVAKELIETRWLSKRQIKALENKFWGIMRKYGIKWGKKEGTGIIGANFEWTICEELFFSRIVDQLKIQSLFVWPNEISEDLQCDNEDKQGQL